MNYLKYAAYFFLVTSMIASCGKDELEEQGPGAPLVFISPSSDVSSSLVGQTVNYRLTAVSDTLIDSVRMYYFLDSNGLGSISESMWKHMQTFSYVNQRKNILSGADEINGIVKYDSLDFPKLGKILYLKARLYTMRKNETPKEKQVKIIFQ